MSKFIKFFEEISLSDVPQVGGKNASLGEMYQFLAPKGINLPNGFATTSPAYYYFLDHAGIRDTIEKILADVDINNVKDLKKRAAKVRSLIMRAKLPKDFEE